MKDKSKILLGFISLIILALVATTVFLAVKKLNSEEKSSETTADTPQNIETGKELEITSVSIKSDGAASKLLEKRYSAIKTKEDFTALLAELDQHSLPQDRIDAIDFSKEMVVIANFGQKPSGGYEIEIKKVSENEKNVLVNVTETTPGENCMTTSILTSPFHLVTVPRSDKEITFIAEYKTNTCQ